MKTLRDLANHIREQSTTYINRHGIPPTLAKAWASEIDQCLDLIETKANTIVAIMAEIIEKDMPQGIFLNARLTKIDQLAFDILDETTSGYVTTKHENEQLPSDWIAKPCVDDKEQICPMINKCNFMPSDCPLLGTDGDPLEEFMTDELSLHDEDEAGYSDHKLGIYPEPLAFDYSTLDQEILDSFEEARTKYDDGRNDIKSETDDDYRLMDWKVVMQIGESGRTSWSVKAGIFSYWSLKRANVAAWIYLVKEATK